MLLLFFKLLLLNIIIINYYAYKKKKDRTDDDDNIKITQIIKKESSKQAAIYDLIRRSLFSNLKRIRYQRTCLLINEVKKLIISQHRIVFFALGIQ